LPLWLLHKIDKKIAKKRSQLWFFYWRFFAKFRPEKNDFDLYKRFLMGKENGPNSPDFELKKFQISPESYENFQKAAKNIEAGCDF
jgi:hypothetical protein